ncbi:MULTISPECIES: hypothetical protein [Streptococcus]|uniref:hypothetical protein n=1 Tax=Streptococcus TaxID=1301 RepID=UPI000429CDC6|nr:MULTISPECIES: hypothetical protein [Streptococcus]NQJ47391.1 hypothetical protein [Streptococcus suis]NQJ54246.1 hypothetical protein [Streptococcus suis]NQM28061.1 hypothetical protein [Streptococcus suis]HEM2769944.1 hypothetical protein [Streptococcus suis]HEM3661154.1 hypothetical protein [Streptococcus suis]
MKWLLSNIHTILLILGFGFIAYAAFLFSAIIGYLVIGLLLVLLAVIINHSAGQSG